MRSHIGICGGNIRIMVSGVSILGVPFAGGCGIISAYPWGPRLQNDG